MIRLISTCCNCTRSPRIAGRSSGTPQGQERGEFRANLDAASAAKLIACGLVLQIVLEDCCGTKPRAARADFDREFGQIVRMLSV